jgi:hypothetical protein
MEPITQPQRDQFYFDRLCRDDALFARFPPGATVSYVSDNSAEPLRRGRVLGIHRAPTPGSYKHYVLVEVSDPSSSYPVVSVPMFIMHQGFITHWNVVPI